MGREMADFYQAEFWEVSAKEGTNVDGVMENMIRNLNVNRMVNSREHLTEQIFVEVEKPDNDFTDTLCSCVIM